MYQKYIMYTWSEKSWEERTALEKKAKEKGKGQQAAGREQNAADWVSNGARNDVPQGHSPGQSRGGGSNTKMKELQERCRIKTNTETGPLTGMTQAKATGERLNGERVERTAQKKRRRRKERGHRLHSWSRMQHTGQAMEREMTYLRGTAPARGEEEEAIPK